MSSSQEILTLLETAPLFRGVSHKLLLKTLSQSRLIALRKGDQLLAPGQMNNHMYMVLAGRLSILLRADQPEPIAMFGEGECVGEMSILGDGHASAYVIAATDCKLLAIDHAALWGLLDNSNEAARNMLGILSRRIRTGDQRAAENLERQQGYSGYSMVDELTGLYNREWMDEKLGRYLQRGTANRQPGFLIVLEMDGYDEFCEKFGVLGSDQALRTIAHTMLSGLRPDDQAGRHTGPQFSVFLPHAASLEDACAVAERLRNAINATAVVLPSGDALPPITISLGVSQAHQEDSLAHLFGRAEQALRTARESGGNCVRSEP